MTTYFIDLTSECINGIDNTLLDIFRSMVRFMLQHELNLIGRKFCDKYVIINKCSNNRFMVEIRRVTKIDML